MIFEVNLAHVQESPESARAAVVAILQLLPVEEAMLAMRQFIALLDDENKEDAPTVPAAVVNLFGGGENANT